MSKNISDEFAYDHLRRHGDEDPSKANAGHRWGKSITLNSLGFPNQKPRNATLVSTQVLPSTTPIAFQLQFSLDGENFAPQLPATYGGNVIVDLTQNIDLKAGAFTQSFTLAPGDAQPFCSVIARALTLTIRIDGEGSPDLFVECVACPVTNVDCAAVTGKPTTFAAAGYDGGISYRFDAAAFVFPGSVPLLIENLLRRQFYIQNNSDTDLGVLFSLTQTISWTPGGEVLSLIIPAGANLTYESFVGCYRGRVQGSVKPGGPTPVGFVLVVEGV